MTRKSLLLISCALAACSVLNDDDPPAQGLDDGGSLPAGSGAGNSGVDNNGRGAGSGGESGRAGGGGAAIGGASGRSGTGGVASTGGKGGSAGESGASAGNAGEGGAGESGTSAGDTGAGGDAGESGAAAGDSGDAGSAGVTAGEGGAGESGDDGGAGTGIFGTGGNAGYPGSDEGGVAGDGGEAGSAGYAPDGGDDAGDEDDAGMCMPWLWGCPCHGGLVPEADAGTCVEPCDLAAHTCSPLATCVNLPASFECVCDGYYTDVHGDGTECEDQHDVEAVGFGNGGINLGSGIAAAPLDSLYLTGSFNQSITFGSDTHVPAGSFDGFVTKLDADLDPVWSRRFGSTGDDRGMAVAASGSTVVVAGHFVDSIEFGAAPLVASGSAAYVAKLDGNDGAEVWSARLPTGANFAWVEFPTGLAVGPDGSVFVAGQLSAPFDFETAEGVITPADVGDAFLIKYSPEGNPLWVRQLGAALWSIGIAVAVDSTGSAILTGMVEGELETDLGPPVGYGYTDAFLAKFDSDGNRLFTQRIGTPSLDYGTAVAIGPRDEIFAAGTFVGLLSFGDEQRPGRTDSLSFFVARLSSEGELLWLATAQAFHATALPYTPVTAVFSIQPVDEEVMIAGNFYTTLALDGATLQSAGGVDVYLARLADDGTLLWAQRYGGPGSDEARGLVLDSSGRLLTTGWVEGPVAFGNEIVSRPLWLGAFVTRMVP